MTLLSRLVAPTSTLLLLAVSFAPVSGDGPANDKADAALKKLLDRLADPQANRERLRQDLLAFRRDHPTTPQAIRAAAALTQLPSPLDALDPAKIPPLERFDWQPKELVAVAVDHRGRHGFPITSVAYEPDGKRVASGGASLVRLWDPSTMRLQQVLGAGSGVNALAWSLDSKTLCAGCSDGYAYLWPTGNDVVPLPTNIHVSTNPVLGVSFTPDGKTLATASFDTQVKIWQGPWDTPPKEPIAVAGGHSKAASCVAFAPDGKTLASGSLDGDVRLWSVNGEIVKELHILKDHGKDGKGVLAVAFDPTAKEQPHLATAGEDGKVRLWKLGRGLPKLLSTLESKNGPIHAVAYSADGQSLAYSEGDLSVRVLDLTTMKERAVLKGHERSVTGVAFSPKDEKGGHSRRLVSGSADWTARLWEDVSKTTPTQKTVITGHLSAAYSAVFTPDCKMLASCSDDKSIRLWDVSGAPTPREKAVMRLPAAAYVMAYLPDSKRLLAAGTNGNQLWDTDTHKDIQTYKGHENYVTSLSLSSDGKQFVTGSVDKTMRLWDVASGKELRRFDGHSAYVTAVSLAPDGKRVASVAGMYQYDERGQIVIKDGKYQYVDCTLRVWDLPNGKEPQRYQGHETPFSGVAFSADSQKVATGSSESALRLWGVTGGGETATLPAKGYVYSPAYSPDGRLLATTGSDARVTIREAESGKVLHEWVIHERIQRVAFAVDGRHLAVTLGTGVVYIFRLPAE